MLTLCVAVRHLPAHLNCISMGDMVQTGSWVGGVCWSIWQKAGGYWMLMALGKRWWLGGRGGGGGSQENDRSGVGGG